MDLRDLKNALVSTLKVCSESDFVEAVKKSGGKRQVASSPRTFLRTIVAFPDLPNGYRHLTSFQIDRILQVRDLGASLVRQRGSLLLRERLSKGGQGSVYLAVRRYRGKETLVAVKAVPDTGPNVQKRFEREAKFLCDSSARNEPGAPHVVRGIDSFSEGGVFYLVMEYKEGQTITQLVDTYANQGRRLPVRVALRVLNGTLNGLEFIHARGFVHRDIKPSNIIYENTNSKPHFATIVDLGIAKDTKHSDTAAGTFMGSPHYVAPECYGGAAKADARCDFYGLAATAFFMLTAVPPSFAMYWGSPLSGKAQHDLKVWADHSPSWIRKHLIEIRPEVPRDLSDLVYRCLDANPKFRAKTVAEMRKVIKPLLDDCEKVRDLQKNFGSTQRAIVHAIKSVVHEIDSKMYPFRQNAEQFTNEVHNIVELFRTGSVLIESIVGAKEFNERLNNLATRFGRILNNVKSKVVHGSTGKSEDDLAKQFWSELVALQQLLPELLTLENELLVLTYGYC